MHQRWFHRNSATRLETVVVCVGSAWIGAAEKTRGGPCLARSRLLVLPGIGRDKGARRCTAGGFQNTDCHQMGYTQSERRAGAERPLSSPSKR